MQGVIFHVYMNAVAYGKILRSIPLAYEQRDKDRLYCFVFIQPATGAQTYIPGKRILEILDNPNIVPICQGEANYIAIINNANFIACILRAFFQALEARDKQILYCKNLTVPQILFPNISSAQQNCTVLGSQFIEIASIALRNGTSLPPDIVPEALLTG
jgi:hypothetical protein